MKLVRWGVGVGVEEEQSDGEILEARNKSSCHGQLRYSYSWS